MLCFLEFRLCTKQYMELFAKNPKPEWLSGWDGVLLFSYCQQLLRVVTTSRCHYNKLVGNEDYVRRKQINKQAKWENLSLHILYISIYNSCEESALVWKSEDMIHSPNPEEAWGQGCWGQFAFFKPERPHTWLQLRTHPPPHWVVMLSWKAIYHRPKQSRLNIQIEHLRFHQE